jgi:predicted nucleotidyltransferase
MIGTDLNRDAVISELQQLKPELNRQFGVIRIGLFGSYARGENVRDSDIDVVVELAEPDLFTLVHIKEVLEHKLNQSVDVILFSRFLNSFLRKRIQNEAIYV